MIKLNNWKMIIFIDIVYDDNVLFKILMLQI